MSDLVSIVSSLATLTGVLILLYTARAERGRIESDRESIDADIATKYQHVAFLAADRISELEKDLSILIAENNDLKKRAARCNEYLGGAYVLYNQLVATGQTPAYTPPERRNNNSA